MHSKIICLTKKIPFLALILPIFLMGSMEFKNIKESRFSANNNQKIYKITAKAKVINPKALKKFNFINKKEVASQAQYYLDGKYITKKYEINFERGFFLEGKFYFYGYEGIIDKEKVFAKEGVADKDEINLYDLTYKTELYTRKKRRLKIAAP